MHTQAITLNKLSSSLAAAALLIPISASALDLDEVDTVVDISFSWTTERQNNYGGRNQVLANMNQSLGITNTAHDNSKTGVYVNMIVTGNAVNYNANSGNTSSIFDLRSGNVPSTVNRRNTTGADVMALNCQMSAAGLAFLGDPRQYAVKFLTGSASAHEFGHTFGCGHGGEGSSFSSGNGETAYAGGWAFRNSNNSRFGTIMTGAQILWYSTPERTFQGRVTGIPNVKDCTRRIRETRRESSRIRNLRPEGGRSGGWWRITNRYSNKNVAIASGSTNNGVRLTQRSGFNSSHQWRFDSAGIGGGWLTSRNRYTNKAIDMMGNTANGGKIHQWSHAPNNTNQHLKFDHNDTGLVRLRFARGGNSLAIDGRNTSNNRELVHWPYGGQSHLTWYMTRENN